MSVTLADVLGARELVAEAAITTPMEVSRWLQTVVDGPVLLKCENLQRTGSFKIRGAYVRMARLSADERARGVVAASAGNHAQGVALAAQMLGIQATVFMPEGAPIPKANATRGACATISRPHVAWPVTMSLWSNGWISTAPVLAEYSPAATSASSTEVPWKTISAP